jgi:predicted AlkP superfamily phosphohydrolase/phosphomutase
MRLVRMFTNAALVGVLAAGYVTALVLQLNPQIPLVSVSAWHWLLAALSVHGVLVTVTVWLLLVIRDAILGTPMQPAWLSVRVLAGTSAAVAGAVAWSSWGNLSGFRAVLTDEAQQRLWTSAFSLSICASLLLLVAVARFSIGRRGRPVTGLVLTVVLAASFVIPFGARGVGEVQVPSVPPATPVSTTPVVSPRVRLILLDGASLSYVTERVAAGRLPAFGFLLDRGAIVDLATLRPTQPEPVWAAAATGKYPPKTGVRSSSVYRARLTDTDAATLLPDYLFSQLLIDFGAVAREDASSAILRARPFWEILADYRLSTGVVRWPLTSPVRPPRGFVISDHFDEASASPLRLADFANAAPTTAAEIARTAFNSVQLTPWTEVLHDDVTPTPASALIARARWDRSYDEAMRQLAVQFPADLLAMRYTGIDVLSRPYFGYSEPGRLVSATRNVAPETQRKYGQALDDYYEWVDDAIGRARSALEPGDLLLVVSGFGMDPVSPAHAIANRILRLPDDTGTHENAPDGFLLAFGTNVAPGRYNRGAIVDLAPTVLYYMGVPVGRDMDGYVRKDIFLRAFTLGRPTTFIASHEQ